MIAIHKKPYLVSCTFNNICGGICIYIKQLYQKNKESMGKDSYLETNMRKAPIM